MGLLMSLLAQMAWQQFHNDNAALKADPVLKRAELKNSQDKIPMDNRDKLICIIYGLIALIALPATWINNIAFMNQADHTGFSIGDFVHAAYVNAASASLTNDLLALATVATIFMVIEGRRLEMRFIWLYILLSPLIAISFTFPLFLLARQIKLSTHQNDLEAMETTEVGQSLT